MADRLVDHPAHAEGFAEAKKRYPTKPKRPVAERVQDICPYKFPSEPFLAWEQGWTDWFMQWAPILQL